MRVAIICLVGALALTAGCSKKPTTSASPSGAPAAVASSTPRTSGAGVFMPHRRAGLWEMAMDTSGGPGVKMTAQMCIDATTDKDMGWHGPRSQSKNCAKNEFHPVLGGVTFDSVCKMGSRTVTSHGVVKGDFDKAYDVDVTTRFDPPQAGVGGDMKTAMKARWLGPCPAGMKPGQVNVGGMHIGGR